MLPVCSVSNIEKPLTSFHVIVWCPQHAFALINFDQDWWLNTLRPRQDGRHFRRHFQMHFFLMKMYKFLLRFHWNLFPRVQLMIFQHWFSEWLVAGQATSHYLKPWWLDHWRIYGSLYLNQLNNIPGMGNRLNIFILNTKVIHGLLKQ